jgi:hypothetical protein
MAIPVIVDIPVIIAIPVVNYTLVVVHELRIRVIVVVVITIAPPKWILIIAGVQTGRVEATRADFQALLIYTTDICRSISSIRFDVLEPNHTRCTTVPNNSLCVLLLWITITIVRVVERLMTIRNVMIVISSTSILCTKTLLPLVIPLVVVLLLIVTWCGERCSLRTCVVNVERNLRNLEMTAVVIRIMALIQAVVTSVISRIVNIIVDITLDVVVLVSTAILNLSLRLKLDGSRRLA